MSAIHRLPQSVVNKIAAGEVIERPASVVKELVENALDAGAMRVDVTLEQGGVELVRVVDNGSGIGPDDLPLAVTAHATSKIQDADDLFRVATLGFRGEALASIAEVSRMTLRSRTADPAQGGAGAELEIVGGQASEVAPCGCPPGTMIEVRNLFFNTPVRRKFLRSAQTEFGHASETLTRLALAHPERHFKLRHNERSVQDLSPTERWPERIAALCGQEIGDNLIAVDSRDGDVRLAGFVAHPSQSRPHPRMQYLFLNGRPIRDRSLQHALSEAFRGLLLTGRHPIAFLRLEMPPELVDVNVHPTKLEVRFQDSGRLYSQLLGTLRTKFLTTDLTHRLQSPDAQPSTDAAAAHDPERASQLREELVTWAKGELAAVTEPAAAATDSAAATDQLPFGFGAPTARSFVPARSPLELNRLDRAWPPGPRQRDTRPLPASVRADALSSRPPAPHLDPVATPTDRPTPAMQVHNRYLIVESDEGVVVIDQHALHERILYEQLRERINSGNVETQNLLVPDPVDLSPAESAAVLAQAELLARLGMRIEPFGGSTVLVTGYPAMLSNIRPGEILQGVVERLMAGGQTLEPRHLLDELLHMIACKAAIKAGDRLTPEEISALVQQRHLAEDTHHCPHGRPTALVFTREELDKQFMRT